MSKKVLGIDVSKRELVTALSLNDQYQHRSFDNSVDGFQKLDQWLRGITPGKPEIYLEATGRYSDDVTDFMHHLGYSVKVINPLQIRSFAKAKLSRHKTDKVDAAIIAGYGSKFDATSYEPISKERQELRVLYRLSQSLKDQLTYCRNHLENEHQLPELVREIWQKTQAHYSE